MTPGLLSAGRGVALFAACSICLGCGSSRGFDEERARQRLTETVDFLEYPVQVIAHGQAGDTDHGTEYWVLLDEQSPDPLKSSHEGRPDPGFVTSRFPANALLSFAASVGVGEDHLSAPTQPDGQLWEWSSDGESIRLRSVPTEKGYLTVVERLP